MKIINLVILVLFIGITSNAQLLQDLPNWRPNDKRGLNTFEPLKSDTTTFRQAKLRIGANFTQQFQLLEHKNTAQTKLDKDGRDVNKLMEIGPGFNLATANLNLDAELADGIRVSLVTYLSSRHHNEAWVKGGYIQIDKAQFLKSDFIDELMKYTTLKIGHMEVNYGDAHFRRTDNGMALFNPFVGNYLMDAFTTEAGAELLLRRNGFFVLGAITDGELRADVTKPLSKKPSYYGKIGYDNYLSDDFRMRISGSICTTAGSVFNTLYGGDRAGSRYYLVMENYLATTSANFTSGRFNPGFRDAVTSVVVNPFIKYKGFELFGNLEMATGKSQEETTNRTWNQIGIDLVYRFGNEEHYYIGGRFNGLKGELVGLSQDPSITRIQLAGGWFINKYILAKIEYVNQSYANFSSLDIRNGGRFNGIVAEGIISF